MLTKEIVKGIAASISAPQMKSDGLQGYGIDAESNYHSSDAVTPEKEMDMKNQTDSEAKVTGEYVEIGDERFYAIRNVDKMRPFFISIVSDSDHWLFVSSSGGLSAGRVSPASSLFPYVTVDKIHDSAVHTGCKTILQVNVGDRHYEWEPFNMEHDGLYSISRHLYKSLLGNKLCFEEINHDLQLVFRYTWASSDEFGFVRLCELKNFGSDTTSISMVDGLQNILPAGVPQLVQSSSSNLVDAYKWTELEQRSGMALFTLYSGITDRAEPHESLKANSVFCLGLTGHKILVSSEQLDQFRLGYELEQESHKRGIRGAYLVNKDFELEPDQLQRWQFVADVELTQGDAVKLRRRLARPDLVAEAIDLSIVHGSDRLSRILARADAYQQTAEQDVSVHHYANVMFNVLRGGIFDDQYRISSRDFTRDIKNFNSYLIQQHADFLDALPETIRYKELLALVKKQADPQLERLCQEYLPITFGRRHGDPSRPWNQFAIKLKDEHGNRLLSYEGNWRDIFQNWEALALSYPEFIENIIAKFVNASTIDGYNPYRITKQGIDWEIEDPDEPWSYIGYWGDHQIIYLLKLLELSNNFHPDRLNNLLHSRIYSYANVPYRIKPFSALLNDAKNTVEFDESLAQKIEHRVEYMGADGKLVLTAEGQVYLVSLLEKLLVPLLSKLGNLVIDGGVWLNTQRPEWNDANNALVGQGLSMVTLYYLRRYINFMHQLLLDTSQDAILSKEVCRWLKETADVMSNVRRSLEQRPLNDTQRYDVLSELGESAARYRHTVYRKESFKAQDRCSIEKIVSLLEDAQAVVDQSIRNNQRDDGLYHAYNLIELNGHQVSIDHLYPMLEGQVAVLSSGAISPEHAVSILETLFESSIYRADQNTFMLYPDRQLPGFFEKNIVPADKVEAIQLLLAMLADGNDDIISRDEDGNYRFNAELINVGRLNEYLESLDDRYKGLVDTACEPLIELYEEVFNHQAFTGRSGGMFGFEGLGCVYWHMVSKLLLAAQENYFRAVSGDSDVEVCERLGRLYYQVRDGIGFNKTPQEYGAFPYDPYSHTPKHAGAQQPGMTGQVKEEILTRYGELGVFVRGGTVSFQPVLLRECEFSSSESSLRYLDVADEWQTLEIPARGLGFTWCQIPIIYQLVDETETEICVTYEDGETEVFASAELSVESSKAIFDRSARIRTLHLSIPSKQLFGS